MGASMSKSDALAFLTAEGNLRVPCSRYGWDSESCAPVAYALCEIIADANGEPIDAEGLDHAMGLVVNDHDDVESLIRAHGTPEHLDLLDD